MENELKKYEPKELLSPVIMHGGEKCFTHSTKIKK
jgi:hypothetical protein